jgi:hypothetical protein
MSHHLPTWAQEMSPGYRGPTVAGTFALLAVVTVLLLALLGWPTADASGSRATRPTTPPPCAQHWPPTCQEASSGR